MPSKDARVMVLAVLGSVAMLALSCDALKTECHVDEDGDPLDPNNIYKCDPSQTCCREEGKPSCCMQKDSSVAAEEQAILWSTLIGFIIVLGLVIWCCRHDGDCCCNDKDGRKSCCGKPIGRKPDDNFVMEDEDGNEVFSNRNDKLDGDSDDDSNDDGDGDAKRKKPNDIKQDVPKSAKEKAANTPPSPTNLSPPSDLPPSYSNLELDEIV